MLRRYGRYSTFREAIIFRSAEHRNRHGAFQCLAKPSSLPAHSQASAARLRFAFAREGNNLVVSGRRDEAGQALAAELRALGAKAEFIRADVRHDEVECRALVEQTLARFGRLDIAVNNAGTEGRLGPITEQTAEN